MRLAGFLLRGLGSSLTLSWRSCLRFRGGTGARRGIWLNKTHCWGLATYYGSDLIFHQSCGRLAQHFTNSALDNGRCTAAGRLGSGLASAQTVNAINDRRKNGSRAGRSRRCLWYSGCRSHSGLGKKSSDVRVFGNIFVYFKRMSE